MKFLALPLSLIVLIGSTGLASAQPNFEELLQQDAALTNKMFKEIKSGQAGICSKPNNQAYCEGIAGRLMDYLSYANNKAQIDYQQYMKLRRNGQPFSKQTHVARMNYLNDMGLIKTLRSNITNLPGLIEPALKNGDSWDKILQTLTPPQILTAQIATSNTAKNPALRKILPQKTNIAIKNQASQADHAESISPLSDVNFKNNNQDSELASFPSFNQNALEDADSSDQH